MDLSTHRGHTRPSSVDPVNVLEAAHRSQCLRGSHRKKDRSFVLTIPPSCMYGLPLRSTPTGHQATSNDPRGDPQQRGLDESGRDHKRGKSSGSTLISRPLTSLNSAGVVLRGRMYDTYISCRPGRHTGHTIVTNGRLRTTKMRWNTLPTPPQRTHTSRGKHRMERRERDDSTKFHPGCFEVTMPLQTPILL